jgi:outer membrane lipoprotein LolB
VRGIFYNIRMTTGICLLISLSACANLNLHPDTGNTVAPPAASTEMVIPPEGHQHLKAIAEVNDFKMSGRIGIQMQGYGLSGPIQWQHTAKLDDIDLFSPFGGKVAQINKTEDGVTLTAQDGKTYQAQDTESLTQRTLGWRIPFTSLSDWIIGRPAKGIASNLSWDETGKLSKLTQDGWEISYMEYQNKNNLDMPSKINLRNAKMNVRLVIEDWDLVQITTAQSAP